MSQQLDPTANHRLVDLLVRAHVERGATRDEAIEIVETLLKREYQRVTGARVRFVRKGGGDGSTPG